MVSLTMQLLHCYHPNHPFLFSFPKTPNPNPNSFRNHYSHALPWRPLVISRIAGPSPPKCFPSDEFPVDETFMDSFGPKNKETEDEARYKNWTERGWAPWEEVLTPEADFARKSLNEGSEVALKSPEAIEAFKMLKPSYRKKKMEEMGLTEDDYYKKQFEVKNIPEPLETVWLSPLVVRHLPPRDWPPRGWEVDREELEFIREAHKLQAERVNIEDLENRSTTVDGSDEMCLDRYKMFLKQYKEWVAANKDRLEEESYKEDQDYYPGRRKRGKDYVEGMYELPFYYPGQICIGEVTTVHLYQGAFINIGGVHDGWVPIKYNDWYWIRHHVKVGMPVTVEIVAKRDPYRFRFPIEMRLLDPNIDHLIFNRSEPPIFHREGDTNLDELRRDCGRFPVPRKMPGDNPVEEPLISNHPYVDKLWQIHVAEQMIIDDLELNPEKYEGKKLSELSDDEEFDEENSIEYSEAPYKKTVVPKVTLKTSVKELDLEAALAERQSRDKERREVEARGEKYDNGIKMRRNNEMDEYDLIHWQRSHEERQALIRDIACRRALGLPLEEPGRYEEDSYFGKDKYDPDSPLYRYDYWGEPKNSEKSKQERMTEAHNKSIVGKGTVWYESSYEDCVREREEREAKGIKPRTGDDEDMEINLDTDDDEDDFDYTFGFLKDNNNAEVVEEEEGEEEEETPRVNGTESPTVSDKGMFEA